MNAYTISAGDTLSRIAQRHGTTVEALVRENGIQNADLIHTGAQLRIPGARDEFVNRPTSGAVPALSGQAPSGGTNPTPQVSRTAPVAPGAATGSGDVPFISQYSPAGQEGGYHNGGSNCGPTSMAMIARSFGYGQGMTDAQLINHLGSVGGTTEEGTNCNGIIAMAQAMGKTAKMHGPGADTAWIADQLRQGKKVIANLDYYACPPHQNDSKVGGHYLTVTGMDANGNFLINDPADPNCKVMSPAQLQYAINRNPNGGFQYSIS